MAACREDRRLAAWGARQVLIATMIAASLLAPAPAAAQWFRDEPMPPQAVARIVARQGFTGFAPPRLAGDVYVVQAIDEDGARVRLVIDAYSGRILRPLTASRDIEPPRPARRLRPWDYTPEPDVEEEREVERYRERRWSREDLVPPRPIGRAPSSDLPLSREAEIDLDRETVEPFRPRAIEREQRPEPRGEPPRRAARVEPPAREPAAPARPRAAPASPAAPAPSVQTPARPAETKPEGKPAATAAVPAPAAPKEDVPPATPAAPARADKAEPATPAPAALQPAPAQQPPAAQATATQKTEQPAETGSTPPSKVRVIGGVAPVVPQNSAAAEEGSASEPSKIGQ